ncbi:HD-GYP domain-containing protein [Thermohalobacter berrensis]|uniref:Uncharacterized protein n=1 Tax=Thermohalobacter berrensis TaxID=99594 RepID=A0A419T9S6_9FIRM|nr:HD-GYP domain-containing protein [Thermohalobacter berrensis]RKD34207.1 hypothetical protein BET03_07930 [Thermohalobacter berrensis]
MSNIPNRVKTYIFVMSLIALSLVVCLSKTYNIINIKTLIFFSILAVISESFLIQLYAGGAVSVGFAISLAAIIIGGPLTAGVITAIGFAFRTVKTPNRGYVHIFNTPYYKTVFNISQGIVNTGLAGMVYVYTGGEVYTDNFVFAVIPILFTMITYAILNTTTISTLMSLLSEKNFYVVWTENLKNIFPNMIGVGTIGVIIALAYISYGPGAVLLFFGPLLLARYSFKLYMEMKQVYMDTIQVLTKTIEAKDPYTSGHASRVQEYAVKLARALNLKDKKIENIKRAAILHDIGKIGIDDRILKKPDKLTEDEYNKIKEHPLIGARIIKDVDFLKDVVDIVKYHHERYDGKGYPEGIKGEKIPQEAAILSIADAFDAITSDRPYRKALSIEDALKEIKKNAGTQFNPKLSEIFVKIVSKERKREMQTDVN